LETFRYIRSNPPGSAPITDVQDKELIGAGYYCFKIDSTGPNGLYHLLAMGITLYGVGLITDPIQQEIRVTRQVTEGQFKYRIRVKTGDENHCHDQLR
jgi:hypothetical protein